MRNDIANNKQDIINTQTSLLDIESTFQQTQLSLQSMQMVVDAAEASVIAMQAVVDGTQAELNTTRSLLDVARADLDATRAELADTQNLLDVTQADLTQLEHITSIGAVFLSEGGLAEINDAMSVVVFNEVVVSPDPETDVVSLISNSTGVEVSETGVYQVLATFTSVHNGLLNVTVFGKKKQNCFFFFII